MSRMRCDGDAVCETTPNADLFFYSLPCPRAQYANAIVDWILTRAVTRRENKL